MHDASMPYERALAREARRWIGCAFAVAARELSHGVEGGEFPSKTAAAGSTGVFAVHSPFTSFLLAARLPTGIGLGCGPGPILRSSPVPLPPKAFETLLILLNRSERIVLKDDLMKLLSLAKTGILSHDSSPDDQWRCSASVAMSAKTRERHSSGHRAPSTYQ